ncbi:MAG: antifreeze protein [Ponticaulis sp.]|nr:antifreeze protein [Ponticaulis sp.]|tara:strand:+ start:12585 stop:12899 length:315 start_codon:yes stop_codon:yes gene_type:complete
MAGKKSNQLYSEYWSLSCDAALLAMNAQSVVMMRLMGMTGAWPVHESENLRMWTEKPPAFVNAYWGALTAWGNGAAGHTVLAEALKPLAEVASANARRLSRRKG